MNDGNYYKIKRLEARVDQLEEFCHELSNYISEMQHNSTESHDSLVDQVNKFLHETVVKMEDMDRKIENIQYKKDTNE
jgi:hypothetical protein